MIEMRRHEEFGIFSLYPNLKGERLRLCGYVPKEMSLKTRSLGMLQ